MQRLTKKTNQIYIDANCGFSVTNDIIDKLGQLEDIEEELGIDLITLFKALKNGANFSGKNEKAMGIPFEHIEHSPQLVYGFFKQEWRLLASGYERKVADYGKTWSLNKEDLQ